MVSEALGSPFPSIRNNLRILIDILAQVATNTETSKNVGNAILYETVLSIMDIDSESGLRVPAVNILGRFLLNNDKNIRYVALNTLLKTVSVEGTAVQRHRTTILECLKNPDVSIKRRALELSFALINSQNFRSMTKELITFLETVSEAEFKSSCSSGMLSAVEKYAPGPGKKCAIDTLFEVLRAAGKYVRDDVIFNTIQLVSWNPELQPYVAQESWAALKASSNSYSEKQPLTQVCCWCVGEYGSSLLDGAPLKQIDESGEGKQPTEPVVITEDDVAMVYQQILWNSHISIVTKQYALVSVAKLSSRFPQGSTPKIQEIIDAFKSHLEIDLQQRAVEFSQLFRQYNGMRSAILEQMQPMERDTTMQEEHGEGQGLLSQPPTQANGEHPRSNEDLLGDLIATDSPITSNGIDSLNLLDIPTQSSNINNLAPTINSGKESANILDLLGTLDLGGNNSGMIPTNISNTTTATNNSLNALPGMFGTMPNKVDINNIPSLTVYNEKGVKIVFSFAKPGGVGNIDINSTATCDHSIAITEFGIQAAVPKSMQLQLEPPSGTNLPPVITQVLKIKNPNNVTLKMKLKLSFLSGNDEKIEEQIQLQNF